MWVKGYSGVKGNEEANQIARSTGWVGKRMIRHYNTGWDQTKIPDTSETAIQRLGFAGIQRSGLHNDRQRTAGSLAMGYQKSGKPLLRMRHHPQRGSPDRVQAHRRRERENTGIGPDRPGVAQDGLGMDMEEQGK